MKKQPSFYSYFTRVPGLLWGRKLVLLALLIFFNPLAVGQGESKMHREMLCARCDFSLHLKADGTVWAWGSNAEGMLGDGTLTDSGKPVQVKGLKDIIAITACHGWRSHSLAVKGDGTVWAWGDNRYGQLGDNSTTGRRTPVQVHQLTGVIEVAGGLDHSLALKGDGTVWAWGANHSGQLGIDGESPYSPVPVQVKDLKEVSAIASGSHHCLALKRDGTLWAWGQNHKGQLGDGQLASKRLPAPVPGLTQVTLIGAGDNLSLACRFDGSAWAWGENRSGQLGDGTTQNQLTPVPILGVRNVAAFSAGNILSSRTLALTADGRVWSWGLKWEADPLNETTPGKIQTPTPVPGLPKITTLASGSHHYLAMDENHRIWAWGQNNCGQFGDGRAPSVFSPIAVPTAPGVAALSCGLQRSLALHEDGSVWTWGNTRVRTGAAGDCHPPEDWAGQDDCQCLEECIGDQDPGDFKPLAGLPTDGALKVEGLSDITAITAGGWHNLALKSDGTVWAWGSNYCGQLGTGPRTGTAKPVQVPGLAQITAIAAGDRHSLALCRDGTVWAWGCNWYCQLGLRKALHVWSPVRIPDLRDVTTLGSWEIFSVILKRDGTVWTWGGRRFSKIQAVPTLLEGLTEVIAVAPGDGNLLALKSDGTVWSWGSKDGEGLGMQPPQPVAGLKDITTIAAGYAIHCAVQSDGRFWFWGRNMFSKPEEVNEPSHFPEPIPVPALDGATAISPGGGFLQVLKADRSRHVWGSDSHGQLGQGRPGHSSKPILVQDGS